MPAKVVDASAIGALLFGEPEAPVISAALEGKDMIAPSLITFEITNICLKKLRKYPEHQAAIRSAYLLFFRMGIKKVEINGPEVLTLAERTGLTAYDATYLWTAQELRIDLVTLDRALENVFLLARKNLSRVTKRGSKP